MGLFQNLVQPAAQGNAQPFMLAWQNFQAQIPPQALVGVNQQPPQAPAPRLVRPRSGN